MAMSLAEFLERLEADPFDPKLVELVEHGFNIRPAHYPFEVLTGFGYVVQTRLFTEYTGGIETLFLAQDGGETLIPQHVRIFDDAKSAAKAAAKVKGYPKEQEDGNCYPRVLKVRLSWIVEGVAFESVVREIKGGEKPEGVA